MNRSLVAQFIIRLQDRTSAGLGAIQRRLQVLAQVARRVALIGGIASAATFMGPISGAAALETRLRDVAVTAGVTGDAIAASVNQMRGELNALARQYRLTTTGLLGAAEVLTARGLDPDEIRAYITNIAELGAASGAAETDLAGLAVAFNRIAGIRDQAGQRLAGAQALRAGQLGGVELKDMARYLPGVLGQMGALQLIGPRAVQNSAAMFQVMRDQFGTTEETAAAFQQMIGHLFSESTQKNARELGLDLPRIFNDAVRQMRAGVDIDPVEALIMRMRQALAGREEQLFQLMPDQNSRMAFDALNRQFGRYLQIRDELRRTDASVVVRAAGDRTSGLGADFRGFQEGVGLIGDRLGEVLGSVLAKLNPHLEAFIDWIDRVRVANPGMLEGWAALALGAVGLTTAIGALGLVAGPLGAGFLILKGSLALLMAPLHGLVRLLMALGAPAGVAAGAVTLLATGMVMAALHIWRNWDRFSGFFRQMARGLVSIAAGVGEYFMGLFTLDARRSVAGLRQIWGGLTGFFTGLWNTIKGVFNDFVTWVDGWTGGAATTALNALLKLIQDLQKAWDAFRTSFTTGELPSIAGVGPALGQFQERQRAAAANRASGFYPPEAVAGASGGAPPPRLDGRVTVEVRPAPGAEIVSTESDNSNVPVTTAPNRGATRSRP